MLGDIGAPELLIILVIVIAVFGVGRLQGIGSALGTSVRDFRRSVRDDDRSADRAAGTREATAGRVDERDDPQAPQG